MIVDWWLTGLCVTVCTSAVHARDEWTTLLGPAHVQDVSLHRAPVAGMGLEFGRRRASVHGPTARLGVRPAATAPCCWDGTENIRGWGWGWWRHHGDVRNQTASRQRSPKTMPSRLSAIDWHIIVAGCVWQVAGMQRSGVCLFRDGRKLCTRKNLAVFLSRVVNIKRQRRGGSDASVGVAYARSQRQCCCLTEDRHRLFYILIYFFCTTRSTYTHNL